MRALQIAGLVTAFSFCVSPAWALTGTFKSGKGTILIWKDSKAMSEGSSLIQAGVHKSNPRMIVPLISCIVEPGDKFVPTDGGFFSSDVLIISGGQSGCRGTVANDYFDYDKEAK